MQTLHSVQAGHTLNPGFSRHTSLIYAINFFCSDECHQKLYLLHNGAVIKQVTGDGYAGIVHFFSAPSQNTTTTTQLFQCVSFSPAGCTSTDVQAEFVNGIIPNTTQSVFPLPIVSNSPSCTALTTPTTTDFSGVNTTTLVETTPTSSMPACNYNPMHDTEPTLDLRITSPPHVLAEVGTSVSSVCEVTGSSLQEVHVTWLYNGSRDMLTDPLEGVEVSLTNTQNDLAVVVMAHLTFEIVRPSHIGSYTCHASVTCPPVEMSSSVTLTVTPTSTTPPPGQTDTPGTMGSDVTEIPTTHSMEVSATTPTILSLKPSHVPLNFIAVIKISKDVQLYWSYPMQETNPIDVTGFKMDWNIAERITSSARTSFPVTIGMEHYTYILSAATFDTSQELLVRVWAYNIHGDGPYSTIRVDSFNGELVHSTWSVSWFVLRLVTPH